MHDTNERQFQRDDALTGVGLSVSILQSCLSYTYELLGAIDSALITKGASRLAEIVELANLSSMLGNLLRAGIAQAPGSVHSANGPHKYPDLLHSTDPDLNVEIKVALEDNNPKGHLAKPGYHLTCHYVLCREDGSFALGKENRGSVIRVWALRFGRLNESHFNLSNTAGDSGKTAVINARGISNLVPVYCDLQLCPYSRRGSRYKALQDIFGSGADQLFKKSQ